MTSLSKEEIERIEEEAEAKYLNGSIATRKEQRGYITGARAECLRSKERIAAVPYQLCPKCHGQGIVGFPPYAIPGVPALSSETQWTCDVCNGSKIIPQFIPDPPKE